MIPLLAILVILAMIAARFWPQLKKLFQQKPPVTPAAPATVSATASTTTTPAPIPTPQKSFIRKASVIIAIVVMIVVFAITSYLLSWKKVADATFVPNRWDSEKLGWQEIAVLKPGEYRFEAAPDRYTKRFYYYEGTKLKMYEIKLSVRQGVTWWDPDPILKGELPLPDHPIGVPIIRIGEEILPMGSVVEVKKGGGIIWGSINVPQNWTNLKGLVPGDSFWHNAGKIRINIEKRRLG